MHEHFCTYYSQPSVFLVQKNITERQTKADMFVPNSIWLNCIVIFSWIQIKNISDKTWNWSRLLYFALVSSGKALLLVDEDKERWRWKRKYEIRNNQTNQPLRQLPLITHFIGWMAADKGRLVPMRLDALQTLRAMVGHVVHSCILIKWFTLLA